MNNMNGIPTIEQYNNQEIPSASTDLLPLAKAESALMNQGVETQPVEIKREGGNQAIFTESTQSEIPIKAADFSVGFVSALQQAPNDTRVEAVLAKLNGKKLPTDI